MGRRKSAKISVKDGRPGWLRNTWYLDQVVDVSVTDREINVAGVQGHTYTLRPTLRREFAKHFFTEIEAVATRQNYVAIVDDEWQASARR